MLELAKSIFQKHADSIENPKDDKRIELETKLCEVYQLLGEVSIENENYEQAVEDLNSCLRRREELLPSDSRSIAETHYQLGVALGFNLRFDDAVKALESSISVLNSRVQKLESKSESQDPSKKDDAFYTREREIEEIKKLIPEIKEKIVDTRDMQEETKKKIKEGGLGAFESSSPSNSDKDKPVTNITNLVKKRKKSGENANGDEPTKKPHLEENGTNGVKTSNGNSEAKTNGKVETSA
uniref:Tetratricopeptide SHNi-TPR domain-containing protein n=2 Tax=Lepeophtheirus salmonis TaxID=72036 RepID=A0A0K2TJ03_LEPSM